MSSERTRWVTAELDEDTHRTLCRRATELGRHPKKLIEEYVTRGLSEDAKADDASFDLRVFATVQTTRRKERLRGQLSQIAWAVIHGQDQEDFDILQSLCEEYGIPVNELMQSVESYKQSPIVAYENGRGVSSAMAWLHNMMKEKSEYPQTVIVALGEKQGYSPNVLNTAKRKLGLVSLRKSKFWVWTLPKKEEEAVVEHFPT